MDCVSVHQISTLISKFESTIKEVNDKINSINKRLDNIEKVIQSNHLISYNEMIKTNHFS